MAGGRGVEHDETVRRQGDRAGKGAEHGDLGRARGAQVLYEHGPGLSVHPLSGLGQDLGGIGRSHLVRVYPAHPQPGRAASASTYDGSNVGRRVGGGELHLVASACQFDGDRHRQGGLADPALAHREHEPSAAFGHLVDQSRQRDSRGAASRDARGHLSHRLLRRGTAQEGAQPVDAHRAPGHQRHLVAVQARKLGRQCRQCRGGPGGERDRQRVGTTCLEHPVDHQPLVGDAQRPQFSAGPCRFAERQDVGRDTSTSTVRSGSARVATAAR